MRNLNLKEYQFTKKVITGSGEVVTITGNYNVKDSVINIMFMPSLNLRGAELVRQNVLAMKIEKCANEVMLEEAEYERVKAAAENYVGQNREDVELIDRILNQTPEIGG